jgi:hypothetical protein
MPIPPRSRRARRRHASALGFTSMGAAVGLRIQCLPQAVLRRAKTLRFLSISRAQKGCRLRTQTRRDGFALDAEHFELTLDVAEDQEITSHRPMLRRFQCNNHAVPREGRQLTALPLSVTYPACL